MTVSASAGAPYLKPKRNEMHAHTLAAGRQTFPFVLNDTPQIVHRIMRGVDDQVRLGADGFEHLAFPFQGRLQTEVARGQRMRSSRGGVAAQQDLVGRVREQKRGTHGKLLDIKEHVLPLAREIGLPQVHTHGQPGVVLGRRVEKQLDQGRSHAGGQPVHAEKAHVLEDSERRAFA